MLPLPLCLCLLCCRLRQLISPGSQRSTLICRWFSASPEPPRFPPISRSIVPSISLQAHIIYPFGQEAELAPGSLGTLLWRFDFTLSYRPRSKNVKSDTLSRQFECLGEETPANSILSEGVVVGPLSWDIKRRVEEGRMRGGSACWVSGWPVVHAGGTEVLQWGQESKVACHPGGRWRMAAGDFLDGRQP